MSRCFIEFANAPVFSFEQLVELPSGLYTTMPNFSSSIRCFSLSVSITKDVDGNFSRDDPLRVSSFCGRLFDITEVVYLASLLPIAFGYKFLGSSVDRLASR